MPIPKAGFYLFRRPNGTIDYARYDENSELRPPAPMEPFKNRREGPDGSLAFCFFDARSIFAHLLDLAELESSGHDMRAACQSLRLHAGILEGLQAAVNACQVFRFDYQDEERRRTNEAATHSPSASA